MLLSISHATRAKYLQEGQQCPILSCNQALGARVTRCSGDVCDLGCSNELIGYLCSQIGGIDWLHGRRRALSGKSIQQLQPMRGHGIVILMTAGYSLRKLMVNYHQDACFVVIGGAYFQMVFLNQLIEIPTLDIFQVKLNVTRSVAYLLQVRHRLTNWPTLRRMPGQVWRSYIRDTTFAMPWWPMASWAQNEISCWYSCGITIMHGRSCNGLCCVAYFTQRIPFLFMNRRAFLCLR